MLAADLDRLAWLDFSELTKKKNKVVEEIYLQLDNNDSCKLVANWQLHWAKGLR